MKTSLLLAALAIGPTAESEVSKPTPTFDEALERVTEVASCQATYRFLDIPSEYDDLLMPMIKMAVISYKIDGGEDETEAWQIASLTAGNASGFQLGYLTGLKQSNRMDSANSYALTYIRTECKEESDSKATS